ncbi:DUF2924 domain-containing protein [uncultured Sphingomonas sp.]|uniref:DUF2924 domain-containing protein n=1 Tax=uncultured Sphingomonas sp. TaxID=158754 RepID=UPI0025CCE194|nr:DUF2924 domain-containing protein [uncultured Sphingomonas sp.]
MRGLDETLAGLQAMSSHELRAEWVRLTGTPRPRISPSLMRLALAWEIQARAHGGLSRTLQQKLEQVARGRTRTSAAVPGMRLVREWNGKAHVVTVGEDGGVSWNGRAYASLSAVACAITGTRWSGPAFFGLKSRKQQVAA